jgi:flavorubredoxin
VSQGHHNLLTELLLVLQITDHAAGLQNTNRTIVIPEVLVAVLEQLLEAAQVVLLFSYRGQEFRFGCGHTVEFRA